MNAQVPRPRRPAIIEPETLEYLEGDENPALSSEAAHTAARVLVSSPHGEWTDPDPDVKSRLLEVIANRGVDVLAELWAKSPANTLPGTLWRLALIDEWANRDPEALRARHQEGLANPQLEKFIDPDGAASLDLDTWRGDLANLLQGRFSGDFGELLNRTQAELRILAASRGAEWITDQGDELADEVTLRSSALLNTAQELDEAAVLYRQGRLD